MPFAARSFARRVARSSSSRNVKRRSPQTSAVRSGTAGTSTYTATVTSNSVTLADKVSVTYVAGAAASISVAVKSGSAATLTSDDANVGGYLAGILRASTGYALPLTVGAATPGTVALSLTGAPATVGAEGVTATKNGRLKADAVTFQTGRDGVFGTGDLRNGATTVVASIADGRRCAYAVDAYLQGLDLGEIRNRQTLAEPQPEFLSIVPFTGEAKEPRLRLRALRPLLLVDPQEPAPPVPLESEVRIHGPGDDGHDAQ